MLSSKKNNTSVKIRETVDTLDIDITNNRLFVDYNRNINDP